MWERATPDLLLRVTPAVTRKLRHPCRPGAAGRATGQTRWAAWCPVADDPTTHAVEHGADTAAECEPDYRFTLANERTFLAWQRTALGLLAAAVAVVQLVPELTIPGARHALGLLLAVLATFTSAMGLLRWEQADRAIRRGGPLPRHPTPAYLAVGLTVVGLLAIGLMIGNAVTG
jgi:putative membrane protein